MTEIAQQTNSCQTCGVIAELFGYKTASGMEWYCAKHRLAQYWADARQGDAVFASSPSWEGWHGR